MQMIVKVLPWLIIVVRGLCSATSLLWTELAMRAPQGRRAILHLDIAISAVCEQGKVFRIACSASKGSM